jgi:YD repeat-containing protein
MTAQVTMTNQPGGAESTQSFIIAEGQWTNLFYQVILGDYPMGNISAQLIITDQNNNEVIHMYGAGNQTFPFFFQPGQYLIKMISPDIPESNLHTEISYKSGPITQTVNKILGGIRVKQTADFDPVAGKSIIKKYEYPATAMLAGPRTNEDYLGTTKEMAPFTCQGNPPDPWLMFEYKCYYMTRSSASKYSFGDISGSHIAYPTAKVIYGQNGENGYSESFFHYTPAIDGGGFPYAPALVYDSRNGLLLSQKDYNAAGILVKQTNNNYQFDEKYNELSVKIGFTYDHPYRDASSQGQYYDEILKAYYNIISEHAKKVSTSVVQYDPSGGNPVSSATNYFYDNPQYLQPTREETTDSKNNLIRTQSIFPGSYTGIPVYVEMKNRNIIAPVEQVQTNVTLNKELSRIKTNYQFFLGNTQILPGTIESSALGAVLKTDLTVNAYDSKGNIQEFTGKDGVINVIIWGYNQQYPVAKVTGKSYNDAITLSGIDMMIVNNPVDDNSMRTELNKLRNLTGTMVTTLTYKPLIGVTSETDARGYTKYYEYDAQGRLSVIRDQQNNILKKICYNYVGQPEVCPLTPNPTYYFNVQMSQVFTRNNCPGGQTGSQVTYTVAANTYSSTISQADANQQAQNNINTNGQAYANTNGTCTGYTCNTGNCNAADKKCVNGVCETGLRINKTSTYKKGVWTCTYVYRWSDCSESQVYTETGTTACAIGPLCGN